MKNLYNRIRNLVLSNFFEHREENRIEYLTDQVMGEIRVIAINFARYAKENPAENLSELFNKYVEEHH